MRVFSKLFTMAIAAAALVFPSSMLDTAQQNEMVAAHNQSRRAVGVPDVQWSGSVAAKAQAWAETL
ncbi:MAG TPA: CAP domain-containing protein, partial [Terriglobales bacterium]|nr:CAP domain-containing protein [Terriglobales bacterium]